MPGIQWPTFHVISRVYRSVRYAPLKNLNYALFFLRHVKKRMLQESKFDSCKNLFLSTVQLVIADIVYLYIFN